MNNVKVWCLPKKMSEQELISLFWKLVDALTQFPQLKIKGGMDVLILFPTDRMNFGLGKDILVEAKFDEELIDAGSLPAQIAVSITTILREYAPEVQIIGCEVKNRDGRIMGNSKFSISTGVIKQT